MRRFPARRGALTFIACVGTPSLMLGCSSTSGASAASRATAAASAAAAAIDRAAIAAVLAWRDGWNKSVSGQSSMAYRRQFSGKCSMCAEEAEALDRTFGDGNRVSGGRDAVRALKVSQRSSTTIVVDGVLTLGSCAVLAGKRVVNRTKAHTEQISWKVIRADGRWAVANFGATL